MVLSVMLDLVAVVRTVLIRREPMKSLAITLLAVGTLSLLAASSASAWTCKDRMDACFKVAGSELCYEKKRCQGSNYYAPSGKVWQIDGKVEKRSKKK